MSLFANKPATSGGLFSNTGGAAGTGGGGGGGLFANTGGQAGAGAGAGTGGGGGLFANTGGAAGTGAGAGTGTGGGGGLFANTGGAAGAGTGTGTGSGGLFAGNTGGGAGTGAGTGTGGGGLFSGSGTGTGMGTGAGMGGGSYSLSAPAINTHQEAEFNQVLERFSETLDLRNPVTCLFKHPVYQVAQIHGPPPPEAGQFKFLFDQALWEEYQKNLPPQSSKYQFYIGFVIGMEALEKRVKNMINLFESLNKTESEFRAKQDGLLKEYDTKLKEDINRIKRKNFILLDKLLTVHALLEKVALQYNECNRKPNEEMRLYNKYVTLEAVPNEIQTRLLDIRLNRENAKVTKPRNTLSHVTDPESKRNVLDLLTKMKKGVEILNKMHQEDAKDVEQMLKYAENKGKLY